MVLTKCVSRMPSSVARSFMRSTKISSLPATNSLSATQPSLALAIATPSISSATVCVSPASIYIWLPPIEAARSEIVTESSSVIFPLSTASMTSSIVMTLVTEASGSSLCASCSNNTSPLSASTSTAPFAATSNAAFGIRSPAGASLTVSTSIGSCVGSRSFSFDTPTNPQRIKLTPTSDDTILFHIKSPALSRFVIRLSFER